MKRQGWDIRRWTYLLLGAALVFAACGGDDEAAQQAATDATAVTFTLGTQAPVDTVPPQDRYSDVAEGTELSDAVTTLEAMGVDLACNPPENSRVCPGGALTKAMAAAIVVSAFDIVDDGTKSPYGDIENHKYESSINALFQQNAAIGCDDGGFCPSDPMIRGEAIATILVAGATPDPGTTIDAFTDDDGYQFESLINAAAFLKIATGSDPTSGTIEHLEPIQRRHLIIMIYRLLMLDSQ